MKELLKDLRDNNILLQVVDGKLNVFTSDADVDPALIAAIRERKAELLQFLSDSALTDRLEEDIPLIPLRDDYVPSSAQRRLWMLSQLTQGSLAYHMTKTYVLEGELEQDTFEYALNTLVSRHESLRTIFTINEKEEIRQVILPPEATGFVLTGYDLRREAAPEARLNELVRQQWDTPFDLSAGPLMRAALLRIGENNWVFCCVMHHIISDGWSMGVMIRELLLLYETRCSGRPFPLPPLRLQYKDYSTWQQSALKDPSLQTHKTYWLEQFAGEIPVLELPTDKTRPVVKSYKGAMVPATFDRELVKRLKTLAGEEGGTLFMALLSALYALLYHYTGQKDIIIGSPIAGREHLDLEDQIGFYINMLALRGRFNDSDNFRELLGRVTRMTLDAYKHQAYPFDELVAELDLTRDRSRNALFDVMVVMQNEEGPVMSGEAAKNIRVSKYEGVEPVTSKYDLSFIFIESGGALQASIEYNTDLYDRDTITRFSDHFQGLLQAVIRQPLTPVRQLDYLGKEETHRLLETFNDTANDFPRDKTIMDLFDQQVNRDPDKIALQSGEREISFRQLNQRVNQLGHYLQINYHIAPDDIIGIQLHRSERMIIAILGVLRAGGAYMPIDPEYPAERIDYMITNSRCKAVIDEEELAYFENVRSAYETKPVKTFTKPTDLAYVIYTSGSTGRPKGCMLQHRGLINRIEWMWRQFDFTTDDVILQKTSYTFDVSVWEIFLPLCWGAKMILCPKEDARSPEKILSLIRQYQVTGLHFVPPMLTSFISALFDQKDLKEQLKSLRRVITSGEALLPETVRAWYDQLDIPIHNLYGPTEASIDVTYYTTRAGDAKIPIGRPIWNTQLYILSEAGRLVPVGVAGELCIGGVGLARGYLNNPVLTEEKFFANPFKKDHRLYKTGDLGRWLPDGNIEFMGRKDDQVKIRGYRIELEEITCCLQSHPDIAAAVVIAADSGKGEKELVAYMVGKTALDLGSLRSHLSKTLPAYMLPAHFVPLRELPLTGSGKIDRKKLPDPAEAALSGAVEYVAPKDEMECQLIAIVEDITRRKGIGMKHDFFAMGGDSIKVITFVVRVKRLMGLDISVGELYGSGILEDWAACLRNRERGTDPQGIYQHLTVGLEEIGEIKALIEEEDKDLRILPPRYEDIYPLVRIEQGMIYSSLMNTREPVYYDQYAFVVRIDGLDRFKERLSCIVRRHPILRTKYYISSYSRPVKVVLPEIHLPFTFEDLSLQSKEEKKTRIDQRIADDLAIRLSFDDELLWRINLFKLEGDEYYIIYSVHHALLDGWSVSVIKTELSDPGDLAPLKYSYKDYCAISLGRKTEASVESYWKNLLQGYTRNKWPFNYKGLRIGETPGMRKVSRSIDQGLLEDLTRLAERHRWSFKAICLAAHVCLLHIICAQRDITTGVVTHDRPAIEGGENILGCFLTTIPIRVEFDKLTDILSLLTQVNAFIAGVKANEVHLSEVARMIGDRTSFGNPIFDTLLNYTDFHTFEKIQGNDLINILEAGHNTSELEVSNEMTNTLFDVEVSKTLNRFSARIKYAPSCFHEQDVRYALDLYVRILEGFAKDVHQPLAVLNVLPPAELKEVLVDFNATGAPYAKEKSIHQLFEEQVAKTPDAIALRQDNIGLSYSSLNEQANRLAGYLIRMGVNQGDNVGLHVSRSFGMIIGMYGILKAGAAYVPIDPEYPFERQEYIIRNSGVEKVLSDVQQPLIDQLEGIKVIPLNLAGGSGQNPGIRHRSNALAYTIYTSGSTGRPKGVMIEHHSVVNLVEWVNKEYNIGPEDRLLFITSMCFDLSVYDIFGMLAAGGTVVIARNEEVQDISSLKRLLIDEHITFWDSVPTTMSYLVGQLSVGLDQPTPADRPSPTSPDRPSPAGPEVYQQQDLRLVFLSGDWIPVQLPDRIRQFFPRARVISLGGATEATVWSNYYPIGKVEEAWSSIPYGKPIQNNSFYILNDQLQPVPKGVAGDLYIGGVGVAEGYANDKEKTAAAFKPDPFNGAPGAMMYRTGDLGRMLPDGNMEFLGRKDNQVKIRGFRVELGEIESLLQRHESIKEAIVDVFKDAGGLNQLCAYLVTEPVQDLQEIKTYLKGLLPSYMIPAYFMVLDAFPLNSNGKIDRKSLPQPVAGGNDQSREYVPPATELQVRVEEMWRSILQAEKIGIRDDLFAVGANSLSVGAFLNQVRREMGLTINIRNVFIEPTVEAIAGEIEKIKWAKGELFEMNTITDTESFSI